MFKQSEEHAQKIRQRGLWRTRVITQPLPEAHVLISNEKYINFCSSDYLGQSPRIKRPCNRVFRNLVWDSHLLLSGYSVECKALERHSVVFLF
jgi:7-keto-8-aminopelargonate synthetase-like enzyme